MSFKVEKSNAMPPAINRRGQFKLIITNILQTNLLKDAVSKKKQTRKKSI